MASTVAMVSMVRSDPQLLPQLSALFQLSPVKAPRSKQGH
jgi:hypothetical protein